MNKLCHFDIHCDDVERAARFYQRLFDWRCNAYPGMSLSEFVQIKTADGATIGGLQSRKFNPADRDLVGFECSIRVTDIDATAKVAESLGAKVLMPKTAIPGVGWIFKFLDTEGNLCCAVAHDSSAGVGSSGS
jgi:predicted enzyme related to lactoylglutathione lyase